MPLGTNMLKIILLIMSLLSITSGNNITVNRKHEILDMRSGIAKDLKTAASEIDQAAAELESKVDSSGSETKSEGIDHEEGNIPFEWRVQLIHRRMGDSWNNRHDSETRQGNGQNEYRFDRFKDLVDHGQLRERYRKKKIDILIEEWWNKEKWNRYAWDDGKAKQDKYKHDKGREYANRGRTRTKQEGGHSRKSKQHHPISDAAENHSGLASSPVRGYAKRNRRRRLHPRPTNTRPYFAESRYQRLKLSSLDGRPVCARIRNDFCEYDPDYPEKIVNAMVNSNITNFRKLIQSARAQWNSSGFGSAKEVNSVVRSPAPCHGHVTKAKPLWAPNYSGEWKLIVNTRKYSQTYLLQRCSKKTINCASVNQVRCTQTYGSLPLVAVDLTRDRKLHVDWFALPFACYCRRIEFTNNF